MQHARTLVRGGGRESNQKGGDASGLSELYNWGADTQPPQTQKRKQLHLESAFRKQFFEHRCRNKSSEVLDVTEHFDIFEAWGEYISIEKRLRK